MAENTPQHELVDLSTHQDRYPAWLERARPALEAKDWTSAFKGYPGLRFATAPWCTPGKPLAESKIALLSTAGVYVAGDQPPFDAENIEGDWRLREIPVDCDRNKLAIAHTHYDHKFAEQDLNVVLPLDRLEELRGEGLYQEIAPVVFSISGYCTRGDLIIERTAPQVVERLKQMEVDALLHIPV